MKNAVTLGISLSRVLVIGTLVVSALLSGCASSTQAPSTYLLPAQPPAQGIAHNRAAMVAPGTAPTLAIRAVNLAPFLEVKGIVFQLDDVRLQEANGHQWAEPLSAIVERGLRDRLSTRLPHSLVMLNRDSGANTPELILQVSVDQFQGLYSGYAAVSGQWQLSDAANKALAQQQFDIQVPLDNDGYPALVRALSRGLDQLSDEISTQASELQKR
ncbi:PqiC family protein [Halomonas halocynthiae]|uniref:PqiC family protein n=1 Tax=Halomonas halocynthiae TaxID=176290 RepID=UPI0003F92B51|nr:ABC-type transport auxiliary lipoprotein family protein [Halomonas halocynthiae]